MGRAIVSCRGGGCSQHVGGDDTKLSTAVQTSRYKHTPCFSNKSSLVSLDSTPPRHVTAYCRGARRRPYYYSPRTPLLTFRPRGPQHRYLLPLFGTTFFSLASILPSFVLVCAGSHARATRVCVDHERLATLDGPHQLVSSPCERRVRKPLPSVCADIAATACRSLQHSEAQHASHHPDQVRQQDALRHRHGVEWWHNDRNRGARVE